MTDTQVHFIYDDSFGREEKQNVIREVFTIQGLDPAEDYSTILDQIAELDNAFFSASFGSITVTVDVVYDDAGNALDLPSLRVSLRESYFLYPFENKPAEMAYEHIDDFVELVRRIYDASRAAGYDPMYVFGAAPSQVTALRGEYRTIATTSDGLHEGTVEQLYWLQILPPEMVADLGRDRVLSAPAARVDEIENGAVLLVAIDLPETPTEEFIELERYFSFEPDW